MVDITDSEAYAFAKNYSGSGDWLDEANSHDGAITGATWVDNSGDSYFDFGTNDQIAIPDAANLDFAVGVSFTIGVAVHAADYSTGATQSFINKRTGSASGWLLRVTGAASGRFEIEDTSANNPEDSITGFSDNTKHTVIGVRNVGDDDLEIFLDGTGSGSPTTDSTTATLANAEDVILGGPAGGADLIGRIYSYCIIRQALSDAEIGVLHTQLFDQNLGGIAGHWGLRVASWVLAGTSGLWLPSHASDILDMV